MKLVSVIIPCYKDSKTLCRAINSVVAQSHKPIEIIVINDCSPETKIIEKYLNKFYNPQVHQVWTNEVSTK
jgi:glycosyltransferase involved in cell wall biosynthesis